MLSRHAQRVYGASHRRRSKAASIECGGDGADGEDPADPGSLVTRNGGAAKRNREFEEALRRRDLRVVLWMIANGDVSAQYETVGGDTALLAAIAAKDAEAVQRIVAGGVSIDQPNKHGYTPLMKAIAASTPSQVLPQVTASRKRPLTKRSSSKYSVPSASHRDGDVDYSDLDEGRGPALEHYDNSMVALVLQFNPLLSAQDASGKTAMDWARLRRNQGAVRMLEAKETGEMLHNASSSSRQQRIAECWDTLARNDSYVSTMSTFLSQSSFSEQFFIGFLRSTTVNLKTFMEALGDLQRVDSKAVDKAGHYRQFFVDVEMQDGWTPLVKCAALGYLAAVQELLGMGATLELETRLRHTATTWASYCGHEAVVLHLLRVGVDVTRTTREGRTALIHAVVNSQPKIVHHLLIALRNHSLPNSPSETFDALTVDDKRRRKQQDGEWHESFLGFVLHRDQHGKTALDYAENKCVRESPPRRSSRSTGSHDDLTPSDQVLKQLQTAIAEAEAHRDYVLLHRERTSATQCKHDGCDFVAPKDVLPTHEAHYCAKRTVKCERCSQSFIFESKTQHEASTCLQRLVPCPNLQFGCRERVVFADSAHHSSTHCRKRLVDCRRECEATVSFDQLDDHETSKCPLRAVECELGCSSTLVARDVKTHQRKNCPKRLVECIGSFHPLELVEKTSSGLNGRHGAGCGMFVKANDMAFHVTTLCAMRKRPCKWTPRGCDQSIGGAVEALAQHEEHECKFRPVACRNEGCARSGEIPACFIEEHYAWQCMLEKKPCTNGCRPTTGEEDVGGCSDKRLLLPEHLRAVHCLGDAGDCPLRSTRCPLDLCGKRIRLYDSDRGAISTLMTADVSLGRQERRSISLKALRERVKRSSTALLSLEQGDGLNCMPVSVLRNDVARTYLAGWLREHHEHLEIDLQQAEAEKRAASICGTVLSFDGSRQVHFIQFSDGHREWRSLLHREFDVLDIDTDPTATDESTNDTRLLTCGAIRANSVARHVELDCPLRLVECPLHCGQRLPSHSVAVHVAKRCSLRNSPCRLGCGEVMPFTRLAEHEDASCSLRCVLCEHCHESLPVRTLDDHVREACQAISRPCRLGCSMRVTRRDSTVHEATACAKRLVQCSTCEENVFAGDLDAHALDECPLRTFGPCQANCGQVLKHNQVTHHLLFECHQRVVACSFCGDRVVSALLTQHKTLLCLQRLVFCRRGCGQQLKDVDADAHELGQCSRRLTACPNHCGVQVPLHQLDTHVQSECLMRPLECPLGCQDRMLACLVQEHWKRCRQRLVPCGTGSKACGRPIRLWVAGRKLSRCSRHDESALLFAIKSHDVDLAVYLLQSVDDPADTAVNAEFSSNGFAPLVLAAALGDEEMMKLLLRFGASVNLETSRGRTALMEATMAGNPETVKLLLEHRADVFHTNKRGRTVLSLARELAAAGSVSSDITSSKTADYGQVLELLEAQAALARDQRALFVAIACSDYDWVSSCLKYGQRPGTTGTKAEIEAAADPEQALKLELSRKQTEAEQAQQELAVAVRVFDESVADTEAKTSAASSLSAQVDNCARQMQRVEQSREQSETESSALEVDMLGLIREITAQSVTALLSASVPSEEALVVMKAICLMCNALPRGRRDAAEYSDAEWWKTAQALLMDRSLLRRLRGYRSQRISADVMAKVRRECMRSPAFAACAAAFEANTADKTGESMAGETAGRRPATAVAGSGNAVRGDLVNTLAAWVKGVEREYRSQSERQTFVERKRKMAIALNATQETLQQTTFAMKVAARSLPVRQQEVDAARSELLTVEKELAVARERIKTHRLLTYPALCGHTPLSFAAAVGNDAMVHLLLARGATAGYSFEEQSLCASFLQILVRDFQYRRRRQRQQIEDGGAGKSDAATAALVRSVAHTFLLGHYRRKLTHYRQTHRVALHEAVANACPEIAQVLLEHGAALWQRTHILPSRVFPCQPMVASELTPWLSLSAAQRVFRSEGWVLQPLEASKTPPQPRSGKELEPDEAPMTLNMTVRVAMQHYDCKKLYTTGRRPSNPVDVGEVTFYTSTHEFVSAALEKVAARIAQRRREVLARKSVLRKTAEQRALHDLLEQAIVSRDFHAVSALLDRGAHSDYETRVDGVTALMAACIQEVYVTNDDGIDVLAVEFLLARASNCPAVDFESSASGRTALLTCAKFGTRKCANVLLARGARVNYATRRDKRTALMEAARSGQHEFVRWLLNIPETDVLAVDGNGRSALTFAREAGSVEAVNALSAAMSGNRGSAAVSMSGGRVGVSPLHGVCKWGCGFMALREDHEVVRAQVVRDMFPLARHEELECPKRVVKCPLGCSRSSTQNQLLLAEDVDDHLVHQCPLQLVKCEAAKCGLNFQRRNRLQHEQDECTFRVVLCVCGERMIYQKQVIHAKSTCPDRLVACPLGCQGGDELLKFADVKQHQASECPLRHVRCRHGCPASDLIQQTRGAHETQECPLRRVNCRWQCGDVVLARSQLEHERDECESRKVACPSRCGTWRAVGQVMDEHLRSECAKRLTLCSLGCGLRIPLDNMERHTTSECRKRRVKCARCQSDVVQDNLDVHDKRECCMRLTSCGLCGQSNLVHSDLVIHRQEHCRMRVVSCKHGCLTPGLNALDKDKHEQCECKLRPIWCPLGCDAVFPAHLLRSHEREVCAMRFLTCANGCGAELRAKDLAEHEQVYCPMLTKVRGGGGNSRVGGRR